MTGIIVYTTETCPKCRDEVADVSAPRLLNITCAQTQSIRNVCSAHIEMFRTARKKSLQLMHVVQRKIVGTLCNGKGTSIHERIMTVLATWTRAPGSPGSPRMMRAMLSG